ncbi:MAG: calcium/proton exchanger [Capsulimonadaceae bacterium]|nr:calcium/proton exchanger [Capsulimonadaceae bacterium]
MKQLASYSRLSYLLIFLPVSVVLRLTHASELWLFLSCCAAIIPLAELMGIATEDLAKRLGSQLGGLLNATFGNATELIIGFFALSAGQIDLVRASIIGSIIGNILLVLGVSILAGGMKHKMQYFTQDVAETHSINLILASISLAIPAVFATAFHHPLSSTSDAVEHLSIGVAILVLILYIASLIFSLKTHENLFRSGEEEEYEPPAMSKPAAICMLAAAALLISILSEWLVGSVDIAAHGMHVNPTFIGIIIVPIVGNAAEHSTAVMMAIKNKLDITLNIAIGSSTQVALFIAPVLVLAGAISHHQLTYLFGAPELTAVAAAVLIAGFIAGDGKTHWLEGAQLIAVYFIIGMAYYFLPK